LTNFEHLILSTGSTGLDRLPIEGAPSEYQLIKIGPNDVTLYMRQYSTAVVNERGRGKWVADSSRKDNGIVNITLDWLRNIEAFSIPYEESYQKKKIIKIPSKSKTDISIGLMGTLQHDIIKNVIRNLNRIQSSFKYNLEEETIDLGSPDLESTYSYPNLYKKTEEFTLAHKTPHHIFILDRPIENNWFGFWNIERGIFTISDWDKYFAPPAVDAYIAYYIANITLFFISQLSTHEETKSCLKDFCRIKTDIKFGMWSGQLCSDCYKQIQAVIDRGEMTIEQFKSIQNILQYVREEYRQQIS